MYMCHACIYVSPYVTQDNFFVVGVFNFHPRIEIGLITKIALLVAEMFKHLDGQQDADEMTNLQLLSCNPRAFV